MTDRYDIYGNIEDQYQPGSESRVLKNKLDISDPELVDALEQELLVDAEIKAIENLTLDFHFTKAYIYELHGIWLGDLYEWAGRPRSVGIQKAEITYCAPEFIDREMDKFEKVILSKYTPCSFSDSHEIAHAIAIVHGEFEIIHPFREGNGRLGRLIASLMAKQAGYTVPNLSSHIKENWRRYIDGLTEAWGGHYDILTEVFEDILIQEDTE